jgi:hypothetical protein
MRGQKVHTHEKKKSEMYPSFPPASHGVNKRAQHAIPESSEREKKWNERDKKEEMETHTHTLTHPHTHTHTCMHILDTLKSVKPTFGQ